MTILRVSKTFGILTAASLGLSACGGSSNGTLGFTSAPTAAQLLAIGNLVESDFARIAGDPDDPTLNGIAGTVPDKIPTTGTATFTGPGGANVSSRTVTEIVTSAGTTTNIEEEALVGMIGIARVTVDFANAKFEGSVKDMIAVNPETLEAGLAKGSITISDGTYSVGELNPNRMFGTATGSVTAFGTSYAINVPVEGRLRGTNPDVDTVVKAISLNGEDGTVAGTDLISGVSIVGDLDASQKGAFVRR